MEVPSNSFTQNLRDQLFELVKEFDAVLKPDETSKIIYLGTPQNEMSLYNELQERGYQAIIYPARYPYDEQQRINYGTRLAPFIAKAYDKDPKKYQGKPTDPIRFNEEDLQKRELSYRKTGFMLQFMLDTSLSDADKYPLKLSDLVVGMFSLEEAPMKLTWLPSATQKVNIQECPPMGLKGDSYYYYFEASKEQQPYGHKILVVDPSGRGSDETGYAVLYWLNGYIYIQEVGGLIGGYSDTVLLKLANIAKRFKVNEVVIEGNFGDGMYTKLFEPILYKTYRAGVTEVKSVGQKELRILDTLEPVMANHKLCVTPQAIQHDFNTITQGDHKYACFYQLTRLTSDRGSLKHDDRLDALAIGVKYLKDFMGLDADKGIDNLTTEWLESSLESFMGMVTENIGSNNIVSTDDYNSNGHNVSSWVTSKRYN